MTIPLMNRMPSLNGTHPSHHDGPDDPPPVVPQPTLGEQPAHHNLALIGVHDPDRPTPEECGEQAERILCREVKETEIGEAERELSEREHEKAGHQRTIANPKRTETKAKLMILCGVLLICLGMLTGNGSRLAVDATQSWLFAALFAAVLPGIAVGIEVFASWATSYRDRLNAVAASVLGIAGTVFLFSFGQEFAYSQGLAGISETLGAFDYRVMFWSQTFTELALGYALIAKINQWLCRLRQPVLNSSWLELNEVCHGLRQHIRNLRNEATAMDREIIAFDQRKAASDALQAKWQRFLRA